MWLGGAGSGAIGLPLGSLWGSEPDEAETERPGVEPPSPGRAEYIGERRRAAIVFGCWPCLINPTSTRLHQLSSFNLSQCIPQGARMDTYWCWYLYKLPRLVACRCLNEFRGLKIFLSRGSTTIGAATQSRRRRRLAHRDVPRGQLDRVIGPLPASAQAIVFHGEDKGEHPRGWPLGLAGGKLSWNTPGDGPVAGSYCACKGVRYIRAPACIAHSCPFCWEKLAKGDAHTPDLPGSSIRNKCCLQVFCK